MRSQRLASVRSWVMSMQAWRRCAPSALNSRSMTSRAGGLVEIAGRLVGEDEGGLGRERSGAWRRAAARRRRAAPGNASRDARGRPRRARRARRRTRRRGRGTRAAAQRSRCAVMVGTRWKDWNTMPILAARRRARSSSLSALKSAPSTVTRPSSGPLQAGNHHEEGGFARAGAANHGKRIRRPPRSCPILRNMATGPAREGSVTCTSSEPDGGGRGLFQSLIHGTGSRSLTWHGRL